MLYDPRHRADHRGRRRRGGRLRRRRHQRDRTGIDPRTQSSPTACAAGSWRCCTRRRRLVSNSASSTAPRSRPWRRSRPPPATCKPAQRPSTRSAARPVLDVWRHGGTTQRELWEWDGVNLRGPLQVGLAAGVIGFDATSQQILVAGAAGVARWNGTVADAGPTRTGRDQAGLMCVDTANGRLLRSWDNSLWQWSGTSWQDLTTTPMPIMWPRWLSHDATRGRTMMLGDPGAYSTRPVHAEWDGIAWRSLPMPMPPTGPQALYRHAQTFDAARGETVVFGGATGPQRPGPGGRHHPCVERHQLAAGGHHRTDAAPRCGDDLRCGATASRAVRRPQSGDAIDHDRPLGMGRQQLDPGHGVLADGRLGCGARLRPGAATCGRPRCATAHLRVQRHVPGRWLPATDRHWSAAPTRRIRSTSRRWSRALPGMPRASGWWSTASSATTC